MLLESFQGRLIGFPNVEQALTIHTEKLQKLLLYL
jgi:hypothetical protein